MKKKFLATMMAMVCTMALAACGGSPEGNSSTPADGTAESGSTFVRRRK